MPVLVEPFDVALNTISKHLLRLEVAGLVSREVVGRELILQARPRPAARGVYPGRGLLRLLEKPWFRNEARWWNLVSGGVRGLM